jgi:hypothetical protein
MHFSPLSSPLSKEWRLFSQATIHKHVTDPSNAYEPADLQGQEEGCSIGSQVVEEKGGCFKGRFGVGDLSIFNIQTFFSNMKNEANFFVTI